MRAYSTNWHHGPLFQKMCDSYENNAWFWHLSWEESAIFIIFFLYITYNYSIMTDALPKCHPQKKKDNEFCPKFLWLATIARPREKKLKIHRQFTFFAKLVKIKNHKWSTADSVQNTSLVGMSARNFCWLWKSDETMLHSYNNGNSCKSVNKLQVIDTVKLSNYSS